eukprot:TRINITY_DN18522_c0_g1_i5.p1 TRINITY_DN18522_c0_g1~~TRINITY_DN18522_c0_g1_i5.p1  ORF type:complete len:142 (+),score=24.81 TRINITY_DN18522_c0_g1_i5:206-631(+)
MLGCVQPIDDIEYGICRFKARQLPASTQKLDHVPDGWYEAAWKHLPQPAVIVDATSGAVQDANLLAQAVNEDELSARLKQSLKMRQESEHAASWESSCSIAGVRNRTWLWTPTESLKDSHLVFSFRSVVASADIQRLASAE